MADKFRKTRPWRMMLHRDVDLKIGPLVAVTMHGTNIGQIAPPTIIRTTAGERMFRTLKDARACVESYRADFGIDVCSDPYKAA